MAERLGDILLRRRLIDPLQLQAALEEQSQSNRFLGEIFIERGYVSERQLLEILAEQFGTRFVTLDNVKINPIVLRLIPRSMVVEYKFMPIEMRSGVILIAVSNPLDMWPMSVLQGKLNLTDVQIVLSAKADILAAIDKFYGNETE